MFHNPYTFVPALARGADVVPAGCDELGDGEPAGHDTLHDDAWTGRLAVRLTVETPLLVLDTAPVEPDSAGHATYHPLVRGGRPHLPSTSVKGMLRAAYEAVTNSRLGVFTGHDTPLGYRMSARAGLDMVPARISDNGNDVELFTGTARLGQRPSPQAVMYAAWLPRYGDLRPRVRYRDGKNRDPEHGQHVRVRLRLVQHHRWDRGRQAHVSDFRYWVVTEIARAGELLPRARPADERAPRERHSYHEELDETLEADGWVFVSNQNFSRKHDERVFFGTPQVYELTPEVRTAWTNLVEDYRNAHRHADIWERRGRPVDERGRAVNERGRAGRPGPPEGVGKQGGEGKEPAKPWDFLGREPGKTAWSPHQYAEGAEKLKPGDLCYARLDSRGNVEALFPVMIARELHPASPAQLLHPSLRPASTRGELSPADRVFGWVNPGGHGAYRGQLRVGPVRCDQNAADAVERFGGKGLPLAILGQPKPQQGRFYAAGGTSSRPEPLADKAPRRDWYVPGRSLRGRKTYPHHAGLPDEYWKNPTEDRTQKAEDGRYQEYRRPNKPVEQTDRRAGNQPVLTDDGRAFATTGNEPKDEVRDDQNRSVTGWVKPKTMLRFDLDVRNLADLELGALLWLLTLPERHFHRLGFGKPLGFGSVRLDVDWQASELRRGRDWAAYYRSSAAFTGSVGGDGPDEKEAEALVTAFVTASDAAWPGSPHLVAFKAAASGDETTPVHYPRVRPDGMNLRVPVPPDPRGQSFAWFVLNEQERANAFVRAHSLPAADGDPLPVYSATSRTGGPPRGR